MELSIRQLVDLVGEDALTTGARISDAEVRGAEQALGIVLPASFRGLLEVFPPGDFNGALRLICPYPGRPAEMYRQQVTDLCFHFQQANEYIDPVYPMFPAEGGLLPWADINGEYYVCWQYSSTIAPDMWPCVICSAELDMVEPTNRDTLHTLVGLVTGETLIGGILNDPHPTPSFDAELLDS